MQTSAYEVEGELEELEIPPLLFLERKHSEAPFIQEKQWGHSYN